MRLLRVRAPQDGELRARQLTRGFSERRSALPLNRRVVSSPLT